MQHPLLELVSARQHVDVETYRLLQDHPLLDRAAFILDHSYPADLRRPDNQAYIVVKSLSLLNKKETAQALETLLAASVHYSQDPVLQDIQYRVLQEQRDDEARTDYDLRHRFCPRPFTEMDILTGFRSASLCCYSYLPVSVGDLTQADGLEVWQSDTARRIRESILDGSFAYCNKITCPAISRKALRRRQDVDIDGLLASVDKGPTRLNLSYDVTCNLYCPSCRTERRRADAATQKFFTFMARERVLPLLANAQYLEVTGSGDPFASPSMYKVLQLIDGSMTRLDKVLIMTNAQLFSPRVWEAIPGVHGRAHFYVSVDAARPETYARLRRGGTFERLLPRLAAIGELRRQGSVTHFTMTFVVQGGNYREMPDYVRLAKDMGATQVIFSRLTNWGTFTPQGYRRQCVWLPEHDEHEAFCEIMRDPLLRDPLVVVSDLGGFLPPQP